MTLLDRLALHLWRAQAYENYIDRHEWRAKDGNHSMTFGCWGGSIWGDGRPHFDGPGLKSLAWHIIWHWWICGSWFGLRQIIYTWANRRHKEASP